MRIRTRKGGPVHEGNTCACGCGKVWIACGGFACLKSAGIRTRDAVTCKRCLAIRQSKTQ